MLCITNASDDTEDDIMCQNGDAGSNSEVSCDSGSDESFLKHDTDGLGWFSEAGCDMHLPSPVPPRYALLEGGLEIWLASPYGEYLHFPEIH
ncbi:hypothetical protein TNCV_4890891 [Trichonephila clavipes]|nr:hypothetical protein TNCV_4890891 [Trichonephila clavipes]